MADPAALRRRLARRFDPDELRRIKRLWVRHSIAEDARDIDGLVATEAATPTGTNSGPWGGVPPTGLAVSLEVLILFPWDPATQRFSGERIWFDRGAGSNGAGTP